MDLIRPNRVYAPGQQVIRFGVYLYRCPVCKTERRYDDAYGPACTGPSETRDEHPMTPMTLLGRA